MAACGGGSGSGSGSDNKDPGQPLAVAIGLSAASGGTCTLVDAANKRLAEPATTSAGSANFNNVSLPTGLVLLSCSGGTYTDPTTGSSLGAPTLRNWAVVPTAPGALVVVSPLTEIAVRLLGSRPANTDYSSVLGLVSTAFGISGSDLSGTAPTDLARAAATTSDASRHGLAIAALSQLQMEGSLGKTADAVMGALAANIDASGHPKSDATLDVYVHALEAVLDNTRLKSNLGSIGTSLAIAAIQKVDNFVPLASIDYVETNLSPTRDGAADHAIEPGVAGTLLIGGLNLGLNMDVRLGGLVCKLHDLAGVDAETDSAAEELRADCPAQAAGTVQLVVKDAGVVVSQTAINVLVGTAASQRKHALSVAPAPTSANGPATVSGSVTAQAPSIGLPDNRGGHNYAAPRSFAVRGVVVELLDRGAGDVVLMQSSTDANGNYSFVGADAGKRVVVRVEAQLLKTRAAGASTGAVWNLMVRDNTSSTSPKAMYVLDSAELLTTAGAQTQDVVASLGFNADGSAQSASGTERRSAPFSILEVAYSAMTKIEATDANVSFPDVNFYWSPNNVDSGGDKEKGQISTSHYSGGGTMPGVYILGKADVDTDEFDQGVIGHEFGHWLQAVLSYSDSPGGSHANAEFKDASLAFGEGYGTAVGGLLMSNPLYIDTKGVKQSNGSVTDLDAATAAGVRKGFYAEESVQYVLYQIGKKYGFAAFWRAVTTMKDDHHSATVFSFLNRYVAQNPAAPIADLLTAENLRSTDPLGLLPGGSAADPAITADASKGAAASGADDLETLYLPVELASSSVPAAAVVVAPNAPAFCINHNLAGAKTANGLGMLKRFSFKANFTGSLGLKVLDSTGAEIDGKNYTLSARSAKGQALSTFGWAEGNGSQIAVEDNVTYTLRFGRDSADVPLGNQCGNKLSLWRLPARAAGRWRPCCVGCWSGCWAAAAPPIPRRQPRRC